MTTERPTIGMTARLSAKDAATILGCSKRSILNYITSGLLKASLNRRNHYRISGRDLISFWNNH